MTKKEWKEFHKKGMREECAKLGITIPKNATRKQLKAIINDYYENAVVVFTEDGVDLRQTDKPTSVYGVFFTISGTHMVRAESEDAACEWVKINSAHHYIDGNGMGSYSNVDKCVIDGSYKVDDED